MSNRRKPESALFPKQTEFPEAKKMSENFDANMAIYEFFDHLLSRGYVLARREPESGNLLAMRTRPTVEHEVLVFRGVDKLAYALERDRMRAMYPHLATRYGIEDEYEIPAPEYAEQPRLEPVGQAGEFDDDELLSLADAWRGGVFTLTPSYAGVRVKISRCRQLHPELVPKMIPKGTRTLYRVGDLREWEKAYTELGEYSKIGASFAPGQPKGVRVRDLETVTDEPVVEELDALEFLMSKMRGERDVREED